jgi:hypothetical protein
MKKVILVAAFIGLLLFTPLGRHTEARLEIGIIYLLLIFTVTFLYWLLTGCRKSFVDALVSERNQERNQLFTIVFMMGVFGVFIYINNR